MKICICFDNSLELNSVITDRAEIKNIQIRNLNNISDKNIMSACEIICESGEIAAAFVADIINEYIFPKNLASYIKEKYSYIEDFLKSKAMLLTYKKFWCKSPEYLSALRCESEKYLSESQCINISGIVRFRIKKYFDEWKREFDNNVITLRNAYRQTNALIKACIYVSSQKSIKHKVYISCISGRFRYVSESGTGKRYINGKDIFCLLMRDLPEKIFVRIDGREDSKTFVETVSAVFGERVAVVDFY